ncbi:LOW QUALITY PROTEIN: F-box only protein 27-like, partial [Neophocaena asiaeorientalis asiaeorientalis]|uniref:LOW QUALITY PROTEIN: F-box only protein 27-like n=1 Tax=Neophocaena asiaeorientalis asiaeorientalis TaxID=1706337 RepID=A0A341C3C6_NEOAA
WPTREEQWLRCPEWQPGLARRPCTCTSASRGLPASVPAPDPEPEEMPGLGQLPMELLEMVLSHVPPHVLLGHCRQVCQCWCDLVDCQDLRLSILAQDRAALSPVLHTYLPSAGDLRPCILGCFCERRPIGRNLLRNPKGLEGFRDWMMQSSGDGWGEEENLEVRPRATSQDSFLSAYKWCHKKEMLDLEEEGLWPELLYSGKIEICVSAGWTDQQGTACVYELTVQLLDANQTMLHNFSPMPVSIRQGRNSVRFEVNHVFFSFKIGVRFVSVEHWVWDLEFWPEQNGIDLPNASVIPRVRLFK